MNSQKKIKIRTWPDWSKGNPYQRLFNDALASAGCEVSFDCQIDNEWLREHAGSIDVIHIHWPEQIWRFPAGSSVHSIGNLWKFWLFFLQAKRQGVKVIWTIHNLEHHDWVGHIDRLGYSLLSKKSDLVICHSQSAKAAIDKKYGHNDKTIVMMHGNYVGEYPPPRPREVVLKEWGLDEQLPLFVGVGRIRDYKGYDLLGPVARELQGQAQFLIAGVLHEGLDATVLRSLNSDFDNFHLVEKLISEQEFSDIISASEAVLLPYRKVTGSGALHAAWTLGRPAIASDLDYFREVSCPEPKAAKLFPVGSVDSLTDAVKEFVTEDISGRKEAARRICEVYDWKECVSPVADVLESWRSS